MSILLDSHVTRGITFSFVAYTVCLLAIAYISGKITTRNMLQKSVDDFYTGGRGMGMLVIALLTSSSLCSSGTFIGGPSLICSLGVSYFIICFSFFFINLATLGPAGKKMGIIARRINAQTYMDVLLARYNNSPAVLGLV